LKTLHHNCSVAVYASRHRRALRRSRNLAVLSPAVVVLHACWALTPARAAGVGASPATTAKTTITTPVQVHGTVTTSAHRDWVDKTLIALQAVAGFVALTTLVLIWMQLTASAKATRQDRTSEVAAVWTDRKFRPILSPTWAFLTVRDHEECIRKIRPWIEARGGEERCLVDSRAAAAAEAGSEESRLPRAWCNRGPGPPLQGA
jgi:hypothetical protein